MTSPAFIGALNGANAAPPSTAWTPANLANLYAWFQASSPLNTVVSGNYTVWKDLSGNGRDAQLSSGTVARVAASVGSVDAGRFVSGSSASMRVAASTGFVRNKPGAFIGLLTLPEYTGSSTGNIFNSETPDSGFARLFIRYPGPTAKRPSVLGRRLDSDSLQTLTANTDVTGVNVITANMSYTTANAELTAGGTSVGAATFQTAGNTSDSSSNILCSIGNQDGTTQAYGGLIASMILCDAALSASDVAKYQAYEYWRCGQQALLPAGHPYKSAPPTV